jgi:hypothetical protein
MKKVTLRFFGIFGIALFVPLFLFTFSDPHLIERAGKSFIEWRLHADAEEKIDSMALPKQTKLEVMLGNSAKALRERTAARLEAVKRQLKADLPALLADQIAKLRNLDCECRRKWESRFRQAMQNELVSLETTRARLIEFTQVKYMDIVKSLTADVRIFLGTNSLVFILLLVASILKPAAVNHLFLPGALLLISTVVCSFFYLFEQNWFYTIIYNDYTGYSYMGYLFFVFAILSDIVFNKARVTTEILNAGLQAIGQAANLAPC